MKLSERIRKYWEITNYAELADEVAQLEEENAALKRENDAFREYVAAVFEEVGPVIALHQIRNYSNQTQFPLCKKAWANIPEDVRALHTADEQP